MMRRATSFVSRLALVVAVSFGAFGCRARTEPEPPPPFDMSVFVIPPGTVLAEERRLGEEDYRDIHGNEVRRATTLLRSYRLPRTWTEAEFDVWLASTFPRPGWTSLKKTTKVGAYNQFEDDTVLRTLTVGPSQQTNEDYNSETLWAFAITQEVYRLSDETDGTATLAEGATQS